MSGYQYYYYYHKTFPVRNKRLFSAVPGQIWSVCVQYFISIILQYYNSGGQDNTIIQISLKYSQFHWKIFQTC